MTSPCQNERMVVSSFGKIARVRLYVVGHDAGWKGRSPESIETDLHTHNKPGSRTSTTQDRFLCQSCASKPVMEQ